LKPISGLASECSPVITAVIEAMVGTPDATAFSNTTPSSAISSSTGVVSRS